MYYAKKGKPVFPLHWITKEGTCSCGNPSCGSAGKHPITRCGFKDASTSITLIERRWEKWPNANIGIPTGKASNLVVLDIDPRNGGDLSLEDLEDKYGKLPETVESLTGGGGRHIIFKHPGYDIKCSANLLGKGLDIKADGGYIVVPPSNHISGKCYEWELSSSPGQIPVAEAPDFLLKQLNIKSLVKTNIVQAINEIPDGCRNDSLFRLACSMRSRGFDENSIYLAIQNENKLKGTPPVDEKEIRAIVKSSLRYKPSTSTDSPESPDYWEGPIPLDKIDHPSELSANSMPESLYEICSHIAKVMKVPIELPYNLAMPIISTAIGSKISIATPIHEEKNPYWGMTIMESGSRKSPTVSTLLKPIILAERVIQLKWKEAYRLWCSKKELAEAKIRDAKNKKGNSDAKYLALNEIMEAREIIDDEPIEPHLWTQDATPQSLAKLICENKSLGLFSAEGGSVFDGLGQYSKSRGADIGIWLSGHAGDPVKYTRAGSKHYSTDQALLSVGLTLQPEAFQTLAKDEMIIRRGYLARFVVFLPPDPRGKQFYEEGNHLDEIIINKWHNMVFRILETQKNLPSDQVIKLDKLAGKRFLDFGNEIQKRLASTGDLIAIAEWASKLAGLSVRISLAYHFLKDDSLQHPISLETYEQSICACRKMIEHYKCAYRLMGENSNVAKAKMILNQIKEKHLTEVATSLVSKNGWGGCKNVEEARSVLKYLDQNGYIKANKKQNPTKFGVNPLFLSGNSDESGGV
ncbi:MAG: DUF3987 domain-containing protein [bacterium]